MNISKRAFVRLLIITALIFAALGAVAAEPAVSTDLPSDASKAVERYEEDAAKLKADLVKTLQKSQETATKKGDLEAAMAVKAKIEELRTGVAATSSKQAVVAEKENPNGKRPTGAYKDETDRKFVVIYSEPNFKGTKAKLRCPTATTDAWKISFPNDGLHSIQVPKGVTVNLYTGDLGGGKKIVVTESLAEIEGEALGMTSLSVEQTP